MSNQVNIPTLPANVEPSIRRAFDAIRLWSANIQAAQSTIYQQITGGSGSGDTPFDDPSTPPALSGFAATGAFLTIILSWDMPTYNYYAYTEIWRASVDAIGSSVLVGVSPGHILVDTPPAEEASQTFYYWARAVSWGNVAGPYTASVSAHTADNPEYFLDQLSGQISESELATALNTRLNAIETNTTDIGTNTAAIAEEKSIRSLSLAPDYSESNTYALNATANHAGTIYRCTTPITSPEPWNAAHWTAVTTPLYAQYILKLDVNGYVSGFGMSNDGARADFLINADNFAVGKPGQTGVYPFIIGTVDGEQVVCIKTGLIQDASIKSAQIETLAADKLYAASGTIAQAIIGNGEITDAMIDNIIQSTNFITGIQGWRINKAGNCEFNGGTFRGIVHVIAGATGYNNFSDAPTSLSDINMGEYDALSGISDLSWITTGVTVNGRTLTGTDPGSIRATTRELFENGAYLAFSPITTDKSFTMGFSYSGISSRYWIGNSDGTLQCRSGATLTSAGNYAATDVLIITYDSATVRFHKNGTLVYSENIGAGFSYNARFTPSQGASVGKVRFGPYGSPAVGEWTKPGETTIDGNKIYTGDAYVDTLQIKGNAVTVPVGVNQVGSVSQAGIAVWSTVVSGAIDVGGGGLEVLFTGTSSVTATAPAHNNATYVSEQYLGIFVNGVLQKEYKANEASATGEGGFYGVSDLSTIPATVGYFIAGPPAGTLTVTIMVRGTSASYASGSVTSGHALLLGVKR